MSIRKGIKIEAFFVSTLYIYLHLFGSYESLNVVFFYCFYMLGDMNCAQYKNNGKPKIIQACSFLTESDIHMVSIQISLDLTSSFRFLRLFWISVVNFYDYYKSP